MRESQVEKHLVKRVEETGGLIRKIAYRGRRGCPDRLVGWPEKESIAQGSRLGPDRKRISFSYPENLPMRHTLVETKRPLGKARGEQEREHERLRAVGFDVRLLDTIEAVDNFVEEMTR